MPENERGGGLNELGEGVFTVRDGGNAGPIIAVVTVIHPSTMKLGREYWDVVGTNDLDGIPANTNQSYAAFIDDPDGRTWFWNKEPAGLHIAWATNDPPIPARPPTAVGAPGTFVSHTNVGFVRWIHTRMKMG